MDFSIDRKARVYVFERVRAFLLNNKRNGYSAQEISYSLGIPTDNVKDILESNVCFFYYDYSSDFYEGWRLTEHEE